MMHIHDKMPLLLVGSHLRDAHDYDVEPGENVFDVHDRLHDKMSKAFIDEYRKASNDPFDIFDR